MSHVKETEAVVLYGGLHGWLTCRLRVVAVVTSPFARVDGKWCSGGRLWYALAMPISGGDGFSPRCGGERDCPRWWWRVLERKLAFLPPTAVAPMYEASFLKTSS